MPESKRVRAVYGKPLVGKAEAMSEVEAEALKTQALERAGKLAVEAVQKEIRRASWNKTPKDLINSFSYEVKGSTMILSSTHPAVQYLNKGVKPHQMIYLEHAKRPIPIITERGEVIYRQPSGQSLRGGNGWQHPGIKGKHFLDRGVEKAKDAVKEEVMSVCADIIRQALTGEKK